MNYLEELAYWYFRFNGYFLITDFVNHQNEEIARTHDTDILGIRFPFVFENIGGNALDFNQDIVSVDKVICIICEVKSGRYNANEIFANRHIIKQNINRLGIYPLEKVDNIVEHLMSINHWEDRNTIIRKILVETNTSICEKYYSINKMTIVSEILRRKENYRKSQDRLFFNSNLIQFLFSE